MMSKQNKKSTKEEKNTKRPIGDSVINEGMGGKRPALVDKTNQAEVNDKRQTLKNSSNQPVEFVFEQENTGVSRKNGEKTSVNEKVVFGSVATSSSSRSIPETKPILATNNSLSCFENNLDLNENSKLDPPSNSEEEETPDIKSQTLGEMEIENTFIPHIDIDAHDRHDPNAVCEYSGEIYQHLRKVEPTYISGDYMTTKQPHISSSMRSILIDWLIEVAEEYKLSSETLFLSVNYIDRYMAQQQVPRSKLQLLGIVCMLIASKFEEVYAPAVDEFVYIADNTYTKQEIFAMEGDVLNELKFKLCTPSVKGFLRRLMKVIAVDPVTTKHKDEVLALSSYFSELSLLDYNFVSYLPSQIAAAATMLALHSIGLPCWSPTLTYYSGYSEQDATFRACVTELFRVYQSTFAPQTPFPAVKEKYANPKYLKVSHREPPKKSPFNHFFQ